MHLVIQAHCIELIENPVLKLMVYPSNPSPHSLDSSFKQCRGGFGKLYRCRLAWWTVQQSKPKPSQPDWPQLHRESLCCTRSYLPGQPDATAAITAQYAKPGAAGPTRDEGSELYG